MNISELCIKRPVLATVFSLLIIAVGLLGFSYLTTSFLPNFQQNSIMVTTYYPGASAKVVENSITIPLENAISGVANVDNIQSTTQQGISNITINLLSSNDTNEVANEIRNKIYAATIELPSSVKAPTIQIGKGTMDLMDIGFTSDSKSLPELRDYLERFVSQQLQQLPGVADVSIFGANPYAMKISLDPAKMNALNLGVDDITNAIQNNNIQLPAGLIKGQSLEYPITAQTLLSSTQDFNTLVLKNINGALIRLKDIGYASLSEEQENKSIVRIDGKPGVLLSIYNATDANPIIVADEIKKSLAEVQNQLPTDIHFKVVYNQADYMNASVHEVYTSIAIAIIFVAVVIFLFLGSLRTAFIPIATIPVCLIGTFAIMYFCGFSINVITLLALVLSVGLIVDDAIVILENIHRHIEAGTQPLKAAIHGSKEITFAIIAMTLTLAAVYAPIGLVRGKGAEILGSFAFTLAGAVIISGIVALTLSPMMCGYLLSEKKQPHHFINNYLAKLTQQYQNFLQFLLSHRFIIAITALVIAFSGYLLFTHTPKAFMPQEDMGMLLVNVSSASDANPNYTQQQISSINKLVMDYPDVASTFSISSEQMDFNILLATLKPYNKRHANAQQLANDLNTQIQNYPELDNASAFVPSFGSSKQHELAFYIMGNTYSELYNASQKLKEQLKKYPGLFNVNSNVNFDSQQYNLFVNRELAGNLQVNANNIDNTLADFLGGNSVSTFNMNGRNYSVYLQALDQYLHDPNSLNGFYVKNANNQLVSLSSLITLNPILTQETLMHYNRLRSALISAEITPSYSMGQVVSYLQTQLPHILPNNIKFEFTDMAKQMLESSNDTGIIFLLAIVFIYLVLSAQFESFLDPLIILVAIPLAIVGALILLKLMHGSINIYTSIGLVTLIGLIAKHGILITKFANQLCETELDYRSALIKAASLRLRPILMTTAAMICGALPLLLATGASAESRKEIGVVIISGLFFGTFFSLILVPIVYSYAHDLKKRMHAWFETSRL